MALKQNEEGFALPLTLIILATLIVLSTGVSDLSSQQVENARVRQSLWHAEKRAADTLNRYVYDLLTGRHEHGSVFSRGSRIYLDGRQDEVEGTKVRVQDVAGLLSLAKSSAAALQRLAESFTDDRTALELGMQFGDWKDDDDRRRFAGKEMSNYLVEGLAQRPRNAPMRSVDELLALPAMNPQLFDQLRDLTVAGGHANFNVATAPAAVIGPVLDIAPSTVRRIISARESGRWDNVEQLVDEGDWQFDGLPPFTHRNRYRFLLEHEGVEMRIQISLSPYQQNGVFDVLVWQVPDQPRG